MPHQQTLPKILYIDDEKINLSNFKKAFGCQYFIYTAASADAAMKILEKAGEMALVITDQRMPGTTGIEFLAGVAAAWPDTVRIILTAYTDAAEIIEAINQGRVFRYIVKPWNENELSLSIKNAIELYRLTKDNAQLLLELEEKNASLARVNAKLEERVASRTRELHEANVRLKYNNDQLTVSHLKEKKMSAELAELNHSLTKRLRELDQALRNIRDLQRLLPICSYCKKIRDDKDYWHELDAYMQEYTDFSFSHSICPDCYKAEAERIREETMNKPVKNDGKDEE
jgi:response regulator RpfG family c-di-GMP phosphodiesterase